MQDMNRERFFEQLSVHPYTSEDHDTIEAAYVLSKEALRNEQRDSGERGFEHPREVALMLFQRGFRTHKILVAALCHDCMEDGRLPAFFYTRLLGRESAQHIMTLSKKIPTYQPVNNRFAGMIKKNLDTYFAAIASGPLEVRLVKCADRLHNLRTCSVWEPARIRKYLTETEQYILPIADATDIDFARDLRAEVTKLWAQITF